MSTGATYPLSRTKFRVEIDGMDEISGWVRVSGLVKQTEFSELYGDHTGMPRSLPGKIRCGPIKLVRMFDSNPALAKWADAHATEPKNGSVIFLDYTGEEARRFNWSNGWVSYYNPGEFDATPGSEGVAYEEIHITVEDIVPA